MSPLTVPTRKRLFGGAAGDQPVMRVIDVTWQVAGQLSLINTSIYKIKASIIVSTAESRSLWLHHRCHTRQDLKQPSAEMFISATGSTWFSTSSTSTRVLFVDLGCRWITDFLSQTPRPSVVHPFPGHLHLSGPEVGSEHQLKKLDLPKTTMVHPLLLHHSLSDKGCLLCSTSSCRWCCRR